MLEVYPLIKWAHVSVVLVSGALFAFRGSFVAAGASWPMTPALRYLSYGIDTLIVATAAMLLAVLPVSAYSNGWLALKLALLVVYIVLGSLALKRARNKLGIAIATRRPMIATTIMISTSVKPFFSLINMAILLSVYVR